MDVPLPEDPKLSGVCLASAISSFTFLAGTALLTTSKLGVDAKKLIGVKSLMWLNGMLAYSAGLIAWVPTVAISSV